jgi:ribosomal protein S18 acetylase RimI-like enzyme
VDLVELVVYMQDISSRWLEKNDVFIIEDFCKDIKSMIKKLSLINTFGLVFEKNHEIVGYIVYKSLKDKIKIINFIVDEKQRRNKVATFMMQELFSKKKKEIEILVPEENLIMQLFLRNQNFLATQIKEDKGNSFYKFIKKC